MISSVCTSSNIMLQHLGYHLYWSNKTPRFSFPGIGVWRTLLHFTLTYPNTSRFRRITSTMDLTQNSPHPFFFTSPSITVRSMSPVFVETQILDVGQQLKTKFTEGKGSRHTCYLTSPLPTLVPWSFDNVVTSTLYSGVETSQLLVSLVSRLK